jgi:hypothetical protein
MLKDPELLLSLLFTQLTWPSTLVRERAARGIAELLLAGDSRVETYLLDWLREQRLNSMSALVLLALIRVQIDGGQPPRAATVVAALAEKSLLSFMLCGELYGKDGGSPQAHLAHSGQVPAAFVASSFFEEHDQSFVPSIYSLHASRLDKHQIPFRRHWAYEWQLLVESIRPRLSTEPLRFWHAGGVPKGHYRYAAADTVLSEIYRSAFLRALSWVVASGFLPIDLGMLIAADACPINLSLWRTVPKGRPEWWPNPAAGQGAIDTVASQVWEQLRRLWDAQTTRRRWTDEDPLGEEDLLIAASGFVSEGETEYHLRIQSAFQAADGPETPTADQLAEKMMDASRPGVERGLLHFDGRLADFDDKLDFEEIADWRLAPAACAAHVNTRWQFWRMWSDVYVLCPELLKSRGQFACTDAGIIFQDASGSLSGRWDDWTDGLAEEVIDDVPPRAGQVLRASRSIVEAIATATGTTFCWICRLTAYHQRVTYEEHEAVQLHEVFGATLVIR